MVQSFAEWFFSLGYGTASGPEGLWTLAGFIFGGLAYRQCWRFGRIRWRMWRDQKAWRRANPTERRIDRRPDVMSSFTLRSFIFAALFTGAILLGIEAMERPQLSGTGSSAAIAGLTVLMIEMLCGVLVVNDEVTWWRVVAPVPSRRATDGPPEEETV